MHRQMVRRKESYDFERLADAINTSSRMMRFPRERREALIRSMAGPNYSEELSTDQSRPVNLIDLFQKVVIPNIAAQNPRVLLDTWEQEQKPAVNAMEHVLNRKIQKQDFVDIMQRAGADGLYCMAIAMVGLATPADAANSAWGLEAGESFVELVDLDDFLYDPHARRFSSAAWVGYRCRRPLKALQEDDTLSDDRKELEAQADRTYNPEGDQRVSVIGRSQVLGDGSEPEDMAEVIHAYLQRERLFVTFKCDESGRAVVDTNKKPLGVKKFVGPKQGPFYYLSFGLVPNNPLGKGPLQNLSKLDDVVNKLFVKLILQAQDQKKVVGIAGQADADGNRILNARDGQIIKLDDPKNVVTFEFNGPDQQNFLFAESLRQLFSYMAGNMDSFGGLSAQSKTASQDKMLSENASRMIIDMQARMVAFIAKVLGGVAWYEWEHPTAERSYEHKLPGIKRGFKRTVYPRDAKDKSGKPRLLRRQMAYEDLDLRIDPYSIMPQTPQTRLTQMNGVVTGVVIPMMQILSSQGIQFDANAYLEKVGQYLDMPDLAEILTIAAPQQPPQQGGDGGGPKAPPQDRTYTRENVPMRTEKGASQQLQAKLANVNTGGARETAEV